MTLLERIVARAAGGCPVTPADRRAAVDAIIDTLACIVAGSNDAAPGSIRQAHAHIASQGHCDLAGGGRAHAADAALLNGVAAHALDFDDNFGPGMSHASAVLVPALIAMGQQKQATGRQLVDAYLAGLEAQALVGQGVRPAHYAAGWHGTSTVGPIGSAAGVAVIAGLPPEKIVMAMSLAVSTASGPKGQFGTSAKPFHAGVAARNAVEAALLAQAGLTGRADILERPQGFGDLFSGGEPAHWDIPPLDAPHVIGVEGLAPKMHPCCGSTHRSIDLIHDLRREHGFGPNDIEHIELIVGLANARNLAYPDPQDEMQARFSMQYCIARALYQDVLTLDDFTPAAVQDPKMRALFPRISMSVMPQAEERATKKAAHKAVVQLKDGRVLTGSRAYARGNIEAPLSEQAKEAKFIGCLGQETARATYERLLGMDELPNLDLIGAVIASARTAPMGRPAFSEPAKASLEIPIGDLIDLREARSQAVSPDGAMIAFLSNASGLPQIWRCDLDGANMRQLTDMPERVVQFSFSPKSRALLFVTDVGMDERHQLWLLRDGSNTPQALTARPDAMHKWGAWSPCGTRIAWTANDRDSYVMDAVVMDLETGRVQRVRQGTGFQEVLAWTKNGEQLILRDSTRGTADQDLLLLTLASNETRLLPPRAGRTIFQSIKLRGDGNGAFVLCDRGRDFHAVHRLDFADGNLEVLAEIDGHDIDVFALTPDQTGLALAVNHDGFTRLMVTDLSQGPGSAGLREIALPFRGLATTLNYTPEGGLLATLEGPARPASIWRCDPTDGIFTPVTPPIAGKVDLAVLAQPETARFASFDGTEVPYLLYPPRGDRPAAGWPVLFIIHGGPEAQWVPNFRADVQHYLSRGIMVVAPNVRGSTGYGRPYHEADDVEKRMDAVQDLLALARAIAARPEVDAARIGVMGQSYGGYMTLAALTDAPELWRTGIDIYGISNFTTLMETTAPWRRAMRAAEYGTPERNAAFLARISPVHALDRVRAPLLVVHCTDDPRVPIEQGEQVYSRLRGLGRPVDILRVEHEGHGFSRVSSKQKAFGKIAEWLAKTL